VIRSRKTTEKLGNGQLLSGSGFLQNVAPQSLAFSWQKDKDETKQTNNKVYRFLDWNTPNKRISDVHSRRRPIVSGDARFDFSRILSNLPNLLPNFRLNFT